MKRIPDDWSWTGASGNAPLNPCRDPSHNPPTHMVLEPGTYEHECPSCKNKQIVIIPPGATW